MTLDLKRVLELMDTVSGPEWKADLTKLLESEQRVLDVRPKAKSYVVGQHEFLYPLAGDPCPPGGAKVHLLSPGGICVDGPWNPKVYHGWCPLPRRNYDKERAIVALKQV
jgi:hypothetical protein